MAPKSGPTSARPGTAPSSPGDVDRADGGRPPLDRKSGSSRARATSSRGLGKRPVLYQLCRAGERFEVGDGPVDLTRHPHLIIGRGEGQSRAKDGVLHVDDPWMSSRHARIAPQGEAAAGTDPGRFFVEDQGSTNGVLVNGAPADKTPLLHGDIVETGRTFWVYVEEPLSEPLLSEPAEFGAITTWSPVFGRQLLELKQRAKGNEHVVVCGPEGSGKGFLARSLHNLSQRSGRFIHLDCRERKPQRLAVDLFGASGAGGRFHDAAGGTLFLENADALSPELQDRVALAVASAAAPRACRVVAAFSGNVDDAVARVALRPALLDAFQRYVVRMPGLTGRLPDMGLLLDDFLARARGAPALSRDACRAVLRHTFRSHIKGLALVIEAAATLAAAYDPVRGRTGTIDLLHLPVEVVGLEALRGLLPPPLRGNGGDKTSEMPFVPSGTSEPASLLFSDLGDPTDPSMKRSAPPPRPSSARVPVPAAPTDAIDAEQIERALARAHGNVSAAARALGRPRAQVLRWMREFGIETPRAS